MNCWLLEPRRNERKKEGKKEQNLKQLKLLYLYEYYGT
jgi:hypothetical protein